MLGDFVLIAVAYALLLAAIRLQPAGGDNELCWSCGLRAQHKLWCPNR
jgi:hypothetical protein